jgi:hypothetical protein
MSDTLISLLVAASTATFVYTKLGRRIGYGNTQNVWAIVAVSFVIVFIVVITSLHFVFHIS